MEDKMELRNRIFWLMLGGLVIVFFWQVIFLWQVWYFLDHTHQNYPFRAFFAEGLKQGKIHLWCPYIYSGFPLFAEGQAGPVYPLNLLLFFCLPTWIAYHYGVILHYFLAGGFTFLFLKQLSLQRISAFFGAVTFMFSGFMVTHLLHVNIIAVAVWLPLLLFFIERWLATKRKLNFVYAGLVLSMQFFAGHFQFCLYSILGASLYFFFRILFNIVSFGSSQHEKREDELTVLKDKWRFLLLEGAGLFLLIQVIGVGVSAVQLVPTYELKRLSYRFQGFPYNVATTSSLPLRNLITLLIPDFYGNLMKNGVWWGWDTNYWESCIYIGVLPLLLGLSIFLIHRDRYIYLFGGLAFLSLLLAMGHYLPFYRLLYFLPTFNATRIPSRFSYLFSFFFACLGAFSFNHFIQLDRESKQKQLKIVAIALSVLVLLILIFWGLMVAKESHLVSLLKKHTGLQNDNYGQFLKNITQSLVIILMSVGVLLCYCLRRMTKETFAFAAFLLLIVDLLWFGIAYNRTTDRKIYLEKPEEFQFLEKDKEIFRVVVKARSSVGNIPMLGKFSSADGWSPLCIQRYGELIGDINPKGENAKLVFETPRILELLNVKYVLTEEGFDEALSKKEQFELVWDGDYKIYRNKIFLPRAFIAHHAEVMQDEQELLVQLRMKELDLKDTVLLEEVPEEAPDIIVSFESSFVQKQNGKFNTEIPALNSTTEAYFSSVQIEKYSESEVIIKASTVRDGFLVLTDAYYPGWQAFVDGEPRKIYRANYALRAVFLPKGEHTIRWVFNPFSFKLGLGITAITLFVVGFAILIGNRPMKIAQE